VCGKRLRFAINDRASGWPAQGGVLSLPQNRCSAFVLRIGRMLMPQPSVQIQYRRLLPGEVALLRQLNLLFSRAFDDPASYESKPATDAYLMDFLAKDHVSVFVAVNDGRVLGGLVAY